MSLSQGESLVNVDFTAADAPRRTLVVSQYPADHVWESILKQLRDGGWLVAGFDFPSEGGFGLYGESEGLYDEVWMTDERLAAYSARRRSHATYLHITSSEHVLRTRDGRKLAVIIPDFDLPFWRPNYSEDSVDAKVIYGIVHNPNADLVIAISGLPSTDPSTISFDYTVFDSMVTFMSSNKTRKVYKEYVSHSLEQVLSSNLKVSARDHFPALWSVPQTSVKERLVITERGSRCNTSSNGTVYLKVWVPLDQFEETDLNALLAEHAHFPTGTMTSLSPCTWKIIGHDSTRVLLDIACTYAAE